MDSALTEFYVAMLRLAEEFQHNVMLAVALARPRRCPIPIEDCVICRDFYGSLQPTRTISSAR